MGQRPGDLSKSDASPGDMSEMGRRRQALRSGSVETSIAFGEPVASIRMIFPIHIIMALNTFVKEISAISHIRDAYVRFSLTDALGATNRQSWAWQPGDTYRGRANEVFAN